MASIPSFLRAIVHDPSPPGPGVARTYHLLLALVSILAWASLLVQVKVLIGWQGLTPAQTIFLQARGSNPFLRWQDVPSHLFFDDSDTSIVAGCVVGLAVSIFAAAGLYPRVMFAISAMLYLGYCTVAQTFLAFQWDNLLIEASFIALFLNPKQESPVGHWMLRVLLFKVFFESGLAKLQSSTGDWLAGTAMQHYYQTAPIPTRLGWWFHQLPDSWHTLESWWALTFELVLAWGVFGGRVPKTVAACAFLTFLVVDGATANYGFFLPLTFALCAALLPESIAIRGWRSLDSVFRRSTQADSPSYSWRPQPTFAYFRSTGLPLIIAAAWLSASLYAAAVTFTSFQPDPQRWSNVRKWRVSNSYHLFAAITTRRIEPEVQVSTDGNTWTALNMHYKPGPTERPPPFVAPHQPRVDFRLWFHGLSWKQSTPPYVASLLRRVCWDPQAVQSLFVEPLPSKPLAVRIVYWDYQYTTREAQASSGHWWVRSQDGASRDILCDQLGW